MEGTGHPKCSDLGKRRGLGGMAGRLEGRQACIGVKKGTSGRWNGLKKGMEPRHPE